MVHVEIGSNVKFCDKTIANRMDAGDRNKTVLDNILDKENVAGDRDEDVNGNEETVESTDSIIQATEDLADRAECDNEVNVLFEMEHNLSNNRELKRDAVAMRLPDITIPTTEIKLKNIGSKTLVNTKALSKEARTYELETFKQKCLLIFNQEDIDGRPLRHGTQEDVLMLRVTFENLGFYVVEYPDYTRKEIFDVLEIFRKGDFTEYGCIAIAILTHGDVNDYLRAKDRPFSKTEIIEYFNVHFNPTLITKPKVVIIQACRGEQASPAVLVTSSLNDSNVFDGGSEPYTLPVMADMLIAQSSCKGEASARHEICGSWFIQTLCRKINELAQKQDLESILTEVKRVVAVDKLWLFFNELTQQNETCKQMPTVKSTLIRKLYLRKYEPNFVPLSLPNHPASESSETVFDNASATLPPDEAPCHCFLPHFDYIKKCLIYYLDEKPDDLRARGYLRVSDTFENGDKFNGAKAKMARAISEHLLNNATNCDFFRYLYFYKHFSTNCDYNHFGLNYGPCTSRCCVQVSHHS